MSDDRLDPVQALAELARIRVSDTDLHQVLSRISDLAKRTIPGADEVSVSLLRQDEPTTAAFTGPLAVDLDEEQYSQGQGPCLEAAAGGETVVVPDMAADTRWPHYTQRATERGAGSSVSLALPLQQAVTGALNVYATKPHAFDGEAIELARTFAAYAAVAVANATLYSSTAAFAQQMQEAMASRAAIEQAKGILMAQQGCTAEEAFEVMSRASQQSNRKLRDIAAAIVAGAQQAP